MDLEGFLRPRMLGTNSVAALVMAAPAILVERITGVVVDKALAVAAAARKIVAVIERQAARNLAQVTEIDEETGVAWGMREQAVAQGLTVLEFEFVDLVEGKAKAGIGGTVPVVVDGDTMIHA